MNVYILDTDHLSLYGRNHPVIMARLTVSNVQLTTTAINVEEQLRGRLAQIAEAKDATKQSFAYQRLIETVLLLSEFQILPYDEKSQDYYQVLKAQRIYASHPLP
jgi:tRNA(fMet)-specific endonuclease VapC